ncbi:MULTISPECIES: hypothetical protein [Paenibacillus]|uniref:hypothetical protein n=1 Tax=Paenibacillus TaxID=44249 RepID=UPI0011A0FDBF|nr:hypothetical protein [Paenibacillus sp. IHBB 10380]
MSMDIFRAGKGTKVVFTGQGGWNGEAELAARVLTVGEVYIISEISIHQSSTTIYLEGFDERQGFNSVLFEDFFEEEDGINYAEIRVLTSPEFTHFVRDEIRRVNQFRELERVVISVDEFGLGPDDEDRDPPTIVIDIKVRGALWTFWFDTDEGKYDYDIMNDRQVARYLAIKEGKQPELPGIYSYSSKEELI